MSEESGVGGDGGGRAGPPDADDEVEAVRLSVPTMDCPSCATTVEAAVSDVDGVREVSPSATTGELAVRFDPGRASEADVRDAIEAAGYDVVDDEDPDRESVWRTGRAQRTYAGAVALAAGAVVEWGLPGLDGELVAVGGASLTVAAGLFLLSAALAGTPILRDGYGSLRARSLDIDLLMSIGMLGAIAAGLPFEAATLATLFSLAELLERHSMDRARSSLDELRERSPDTATVLRDGEEATVPVEDVAVGDRVVVRPGERVPVDGVVREGTSAVDESPVTGESVPADKAVGDEVYAGSVAEAGYLEVEATAPASESTIARVVDMVADAERERTERERFVDRFARYYTPAIVVAAAATAFGPPLLTGAAFGEWFRRGLVLLVVACPCAFVISTPVSVVSGVTAAARNGVLVKGGRQLESAAAVDAVAVDKTGTLTTGDLAVTDVVALNGTDERDVLACARAVESRSEHPIAEAIVEEADERGVPAREVADFEAIAGRGVRAEVDGRTHYAGKPSLFAELGFDLEHAHVRTDGGSEGGRHLGTDGAGRSDLSPPAEATDPRECDHGAYLDLVNDVVPRLQAEGKTVVLVGTDEGLEGVVAVADQLRPEAPWMVRRLQELGVERVVLLTGDNERTARAIGERVGVDEVRADLLPEEKVDAVKELDAATDGGVLMLGDGVNDAPALAAASAGVAMGAAGTGTAIETADAALLGDDLTRLPYLLELADSAVATIRQNIWSSLAVKAALVVGAPLGLVTVFVAIVVGDMGMSLAVTGNALRLANVRPAEPDAAELTAAEDDAAELTAAEDDAAELTAANERAHTPDDAR